MLSTILVAFDGSAHSEKALRTVLEWGSARDAMVHVVFVARPEELQGIPAEADLFGGKDPSLRLLSRRIEESGKEREERASEIAREHSREISVHRLIGDPGEQILKTAEAIGADLIVVGSRGRSGLERFFLGSISSYVVEHSPISTLVVR